MDLQNIQEQLNTEFAKDSTKYIFWFDDKAEYEDEVRELQLGEVKLHILDGSNWFYSKYLLNEQDAESKYLIYAPFPRPNDAENPLADMYHYSTPYYTDRVSQTSQEMGIDNRYKEQLAQLDDEILDSQIDGFSIAQIADQRSSHVNHYCDTYRYEYRAIKFAYMMMKSVALSYGI